MKAAEINCVALDFETTGAIKGWPNEPWQAGLVCINSGNIEPLTCYESLIHVGERPVNPCAPGLFHQQRTAIAAAPDFNSLWPQLYDRLRNRILAAHNIPTERNLLVKYAPLHRLGPWVDTLKLARKTYHGLASYKLEDLTMRLELQSAAETICPGRQAHDALYDAVCCALLLLHLIHLPAWRDVPLERIIEDR